MDECVQVIWIGEVGSMAKVPAGVMIWMGACAKQTSIKSLAAGAITLGTPVMVSLVRGNLVDCGSYPRSCWFRQ